MEPLQLLLSVREVSLLADPDKPLTVSQRAFDEARSRSEKFADLPPAKRIAARLNTKRRGSRLTWRQILELAHTEDAGEQSISSGEAAPAQDWLTDEQIAFALKFVALRLDADTVSKDQYSSELEAIRLEGADVKRLHLPTESQITGAARRKLRTRERTFPHRVRIRPKKRVRPHETAADSTSLAAKPTDTTPKPTKPASKPTKPALKPIDMAPKPDPTPESAWSFALNLARLQPYEPQREKSISVIELIERCYQAYGVLPSRDDAVVFARANDIPVAREQKLTWTAAVAEWRKERVARGLPCPSAPPPVDKRPDYTKPVGAGEPEKRRLRSWSSIDDCISHVITYLEQLPAGERSSRDGYARWAKQQNANGSVAPSSKPLERHGGWTRVRKLAQARMLPGQQDASISEIEPPPSRKRSRKQTKQDQAVDTTSPAWLIAAISPPRKALQRRRKAK